ncbi:acyl-coa synthetase [Holotrichia oblita]|nr:acyl-coa synthetase [Holotrichia oblita]
MLSFKHMLSKNGTNCKKIDGGQHGINIQEVFMDKLLEITMGELLESMAERFPDTDCVVCNDRPFRKTYAEFNELVNLTAKGFLKLGIRRNDHVAIWATNYPEWLLTMWATAKIGAVLVTVNTNYKTFEAEYLLRQSDTHTLILIDGFKDSNYVEIMNELIPELKGSKHGSWSSEKFPFLKNIIHIDGSDPEAGNESGILSPQKRSDENKNKDGMLNWSELYRLGAGMNDEEFAGYTSGLTIHDVVNMQYTSGTTGFPKGVMLTHHNIVNDGRLIGDCMKLTENDRLCIPVPLFHCFGCVLGVMACITHGTTIVLIEHFSPLPVMKAVQEERCTALHGVPTMFITILQHPEFSNYNFSTLRTGIMSGSPCPVAVMEETVNKMNLTELTIAYGLTETSSVCTQTTTDDSIEHRVTTIGRSLPFMECKIVDPATGEECPPDVPGEFIVKGFNIMKGYYKMPEATAQVIRDGWLHSGDLASRDKDGYYKITGRMKDMIIRGGENIYPKEIEEFLYTHPKVSDVQVISVPSKQYGEEILAYIITKPDETLSEDEVKEYVKKRLARHKIPKYVLFTDFFPMTASGKIQKYKLREKALVDLGLLEEGE